MEQWTFMSAPPKFTSSQEQNKGLHVVARLEAVMTFAWITELGKSCQSLPINLSNIRFAEMANKANILPVDEYQQGKAVAVPSPVPWQNFPYIIYCEGWI